MSPEKEGCASRHRGQARSGIVVRLIHTLEFMRGTGVREAGGEALGERTARAKV